MSDVRIYSNIFQENKPVYAGLELVYSPYTIYFSQRAMTFYDGVCVDEADFLEQCNSDSSVNALGGVQWP